MALYDYQCSKCGFIKEVRHLMSEKPAIKCPECKAKMHQTISGTAYIAIGTGKSIEQHKEEEYMKKVKDPERAARMRKKAFGKDSVGDPPDKNDPRHIVKKGRYKDGGTMDVDKDAVIKAVAKDDAAFNHVQKALKKAKSKKN